MLTVNFVQLVMLSSLWLQTPSVPITFNKPIVVVVVVVVRETKHLSTDADSSTDAIGGWTKAKSATIKNFFLRGDFRPLPNKNVQM